MSDVMKVDNKEIAWNKDQIDAIKNVLCPNLTDNELTLFSQICKKTGLDPFSRQIYVIKTKVWDSSTRSNVDKMQTMTSIDGFRVIAERSNDYAGQVGPFWCGPDGIWKDVWLMKYAPSAAKVGVLRKGFKEPLFRVCLFSEFAKTNKEGQILGQWKTMPTVMLAKCAESQALRTAFPNDLSGLYTAEEMDQAEKEIPRQEVNTFKVDHDVNTKINDPIQSNIKTTSIDLPDTSEFIDKHSTINTTIKMPAPSDEQKKLAYVRKSFIDRVTAISNGNESTKNDIYKRIGLDKTRQDYTETDFKIFENTVIELFIDINKPEKLI